MACNAGINTFVVVVDGNCQGFLGFGLADDVLVKMGHDFGRFEDAHATKTFWITDHILTNDFLA